MKRIAQQLKRDIMDYRYACIAVAVYAIATHAIFRRFCPLAITIGLPCPACGMTRATALLLSGQFAAAARMHVMIYPVVLLTMAFCYTRYISNKSTAYLIRYVGLLLAASLLYYVVRMYLYFPHTEPLTLYEQAVLMQLR